MTHGEDIADPHVIKALSHPLRIKILALLEGNVSSPKELADELEEPLGNVSYHVRTLADLGLIELVKKVPRRGAIEHYYRACEGDGARTNRMIVSVDADGRKQLADEVAGFLGRAKKIGVASTARTEKSSEPLQDMSLVFLLFELPSQQKRS
jgi:DNA-binding transcriptional ArsR family regulator